MDELAKRFSEASSWAGLAAALWGGTMLLPEYLAGGLGIDEPGWRAIGIFVALTATILSIAIPGGRK